MITCTTMTEVETLVAATGLDAEALALIVTEALAEDFGGRGVLPPGTGAGLDVTSVATIPAEATAYGEFVVRQPGTVAGLAVAAYVVARVCAPRVASASRCWPRRARGSRSGRC